MITGPGSTPDMPDMYRALGDLAIVNDDVSAWSDLQRQQ